MSSRTSVETLKEEVSCSICLDLITDPVLIDCGHSYCRSCIVDVFKKEQSETSSCPQCQKPFDMKSIRPNRMLKNVSETISYLEKDSSCEAHREKLQLFCEDHGKLLCWRCEREEHKGHVTTLMEEAHEVYEVKLKEMVKKLEDMDDQCENQNLLLGEQITEWKEKIKTQKEKIQSDFQDYHYFLREEEKSYIERLKLEREKIRGKLQDNKSKLEKQRQELMNYIEELEKKCRRSAHYLLQDVKGILTRGSAIKLEQPEAVSLEIQTLCNVFELHFDANRFKKVEH